MSVTVPSRERRVGADVGVGGGGQSGSTGLHGCVHPSPPKHVGGGNSQYLIRNSLPGSAIIFGHPTASSHTSGVNVQYLMV